MKIHNLKDNFSSKNVCEFLYDSDIRISLLNNKVQFFKIENDNIESLSEAKILDFLTRSFLKERQESSSEKLRFNNFYSTIKKTLKNMEEHLESNLNYVLSEKEKHSLLMQSDLKEKHSTKISEQKELLEIFLFKKVKDENAHYSNDSLLYYRKLENNKYMVVNYYNGKMQKDCLDGFDYWIAVYNNEQEIGKINSLKIEALHYGPDSINPILTYFGHI